LIRVCKPFDKIRICVCVGMCIGIILSVTFLGDIFAISKLSEGMLIYTTFMSIASVPLFWLICSLFSKCGIDKLAVWHRFL